MRRILLVDDDFAVVEVTRMVLEYAGFAVTVAHNGEDALAAAQSERPDLVITDYMMPIMNGGELIRRLRASALLADVPVIMATATMTEVVLAEAQGCAQVLSKPTTVDVLLTAVRRVLGPR
jgi:two-component system response regulator VicR